MEEKKYMDLSNEEEYIDLAVLEKMETFRLGDYLDYTKNMKSPKYELWATLKKNHKGSNRSDIRKKILFNKCKIINEIEDGWEGLLDYIEDFDKISLKQFVYFETTVWREIFDSAIEARKKFSDKIETLYIEHDPKAFFESCNVKGELAKFDIGAYIDNLEEWLLYQKLGEIMVSDTECGDKIFFLSIDV